MTNTKESAAILLMIFSVFLFSCETEKEDVEDKPGIEEVDVEEYVFNCELKPLHDTDKKIDNTVKKEISGTIDFNLSLLKGWMETGNIFLDGKTVDFQDIKIEEESKYSPEFLEFHDAFTQAICFYEEKIKNPSTSEKEKERFIELRDERMDLFFDTLLSKFQANDDDNSLCDKTETLKYKCYLRKGDSTDDELVDTIDVGTQVCIKGEGEYLDIISLGNDKEYNEYWNIVEIPNGRQFDFPVYIFGGCFEGRHHVEEYRRTIIESDFVQISSQSGTFLRPEPSISGQVKNRTRLKRSVILENLRDYKQNYDIIMVDKARHAGTGYWYKVRTRKGNEGYVFQEHITESDIPEDWPFSKPKPHTNTSPSLYAANNVKVVKVVKFQEDELLKSRLITQPDSLKYSGFKKSSTVIYDAKLKRNGKLRTKCITSKNDANFPLAEDLIKDYVFEKQKQGKVMGGRITINFIIKEELIE